MRRRIIAIVFVVAIIAGSWFLYSRSRPVEPAAPEGIVTEKVTRGDVDALVRATGNLATESARSLVFSTSGIVSEVLVEEGDQVVAGQVLARLDTEDLELSLKQAQAALDVSEASLARTRKPASEEEIASARAAVEAAQANLDDLQAGASTRDKQLAKLAVDQAKNSLWGAQGSRDAIAGSPLSGGGSKTSAEAQVANAEVQVQIAEINQAKLYEPPKASVVASAQSQIASAQANLARLLSSPAPEDIAIAEAQVAQAKVSVEVAAGRLNDTELKSPASGELVSWDLHVDDPASPATPVGSMVDLSLFHVQVSIDEIEIAQVKEGQTVRITLDAFPDNQLQGTVAKIDPAGQNLQGLVSYAVRIDLDPTELPIRPLMTASIDIVVDHRENVLLVPNQALRRDPQGIYVEILENNTPTRVSVTSGVADEEHTEILTGLEEGQEIIVTRPRESLSLLGG
ncbi:MAG: hypothetical protein A2Y73_05685 [Chloroflexi bacterium RBG_13_56_8]|nr:MAG: hypothetical protein A2Y73_05685 [Chloroflexi bacterium RBG_13_56_8]